ncbi:MAG: carbon monoxide dehydrogenase subunit G, partial [Myxococcota bacterium]
EVKLAGDYTFDAPRKIVWEALLDPVVLAATLPGCDKLDLIDGVYQGALNVKVGPVQGKFQGKVKLENLRELEGYTMVVDGKGAPGFMKANADIVLTDSESGVTTMTYDSEAKVGGRIASVGQRLLEASAKAIIKQSLDGLNETMRERAAGNAEAVPKQINEAEFARKVASEVTKELIPTPVRYALALAAVAGIGALVYFFFLAR